MAKKSVILATLTAVLMAGSLWAQEPATASEDDEQAAPEAAPEPLHKIKVLENPYDIASFYRSHQGEGSYGYFGAEPGLEGPERYPIAGYYRQRPPNAYGYSRFWTSGYGYGYGRGRRGLVISYGYGRSIGENGDLFLFAPTILAPVGPLTGVFYEGR